MTTTGSIAVTVNGEHHAVQASDLESLLAELGMGERAAAAEINGVAIDSARHAETAIAAGDTIEVIQLVGGG